MEAGTLFAEPLRERAQQNAKSQTGRSVDETSKEIEIVYLFHRTMLSFHALPLGKHRIEIRLVGNDHLDLGPVSTLDLTVTGS